MHLEAVDLEQRRGGLAGGRAGLCCARLRRQLPRQMAAHALAADCLPGR